jgi:transposase
LPSFVPPPAIRQLRAKRSVLEEAFTGHFSDHHGFLLAKMLARVAGLDADIAELDHKLQELIAPFMAATDRLDEICGAGRTAACAIIAEIGTDMGRFPTPGHLASWARFAPGSNNRRARPRATAPPATATRTWPGCSGRPPRLPAGPTPSWRALPAHRPST